VIEDPGETQDLSRDPPATLEELKAAWEHYAKDVGVVLSE
jgi:arylsulfatase